MHETIENIIKKNLPEKKPIITDEQISATPFGAQIQEQYIGFNQALSKIDTKLIADEVLKVVVGKIKEEMPNFLHKYGTFLVLHYDEVEPLERRAKKNELTQEFLNLLTSLSPNKENENNG